MKQVTTLVFLIHSLMSFSQKFEMTYRTTNDTTQNKYLSILPNSIIKGFIVIMPGAGTEPYEVLTETKLPMTAAKNGYAVFIPKLVPFNMVEDTTDKNESLLESLIPEITTKYNLPKDNINQDKIRIARQRDMSINNRDEAVWRLQKVTPIIAVLDKPNPPFDTVKPSKVLFAVLGFVGGLIFTALFLVSGLLYRFSKAEVYNSIFGTDTPAPAS